MLLINKEGETKNCLQQHLRHQATIIPAPQGKAHTIAWLCAIGNTQKKLYKAVQGY